MLQIFFGPQSPYNLCSQPYLVCVHAAILKHHKACIAANPRSEENQSNPSCRTTKLKNCPGGKFPVGKGSTLLTNLQRSRPVAKVWSRMEGTCRQTPQNMSKSFRGAPFGCFSFSFSARFGPFATASPSARPSRSRLRRLRLVLEGCMF